MEEIVMRITIDEVLSDDLIRILVSPLLGGREKFSDENFAYNEKELLINPTDYAAQMGVINKEEYPWTYFEEGQVFLSGYFEVIDDQMPPKEFLVNGKLKNFIRIDRSVKDRMKELYYKILQGEKTGASSKR